MADTPTKRQTIGAAVRGILSVIDQHGLKNEIRGAVSAAAREVLDHPPIHIAWVDSALIDELLTQVAAMRDRNFVRELGHEATRGSAGPVLLPMIKMFLSLSGATPASIFSNLHRLIPLEVKGLTCKYEAVDERSGVVELRFSEPVAPFSFAVWEGALRFAYDVCKVKGKVDQAELSDDGASARLRVHW